MLLEGADRGDFACHRSLSHISSCVIHSFSMTYLQQPPSCSMSKPSHTSSPPRCQHKSDMPAHTASVVMSVHIQNSFHVSNHVQRQSTYFRNPTQASLLQRKITQEILQPDMECGSVGTVEKPGTILIWYKFDSWAARDFSPTINSKCRLSQSYGINRAPGCSSRHQRMHTH